MIQCNYKYNLRRIESINKLQITLCENLNSENKRNIIKAIIPQYIRIPHIWLSFSMYCAVYRKYKFICHALLCIL